MQHLRLNNKIAGKENEINEAEAKLVALEVDFNNKYGKLPEFASKIDALKNIERRIAYLEESLINLAINRQLKSISHDKFQTQKNKYNTKIEGLKAAKESIEAVSPSNFIAERRGALKEIKKQEKEKLNLEIALKNTKRKLDYYARKLPKLEAKLANDSTDVSEIQDILGAKKRRGLSKMYGIG